MVARGVGIVGVRRVRRKPFDRPYRATNGPGATTVATNAATVWGQVVPRVQPLEDVLGAVDGFGLAPEVPFGQPALPVPVLGDA